MVKNLRKYPHMFDEAYTTKRFGSAAGMGPLVLPFIEGQRRRIIYTLTEYEPLLDSSNMTITEWVRIAEDIKVGCVTSHDIPLPPTKAHHLLFLLPAALVRVLRWLRHSARH